MRGKLYCNSDVRIWPFTCCKISLNYGLIHHMPWTTLRAIWDKLSQYWHALQPQWEIFLKRYIFIWLVRHSYLFHLPSSQIKNLYFFASLHTSNWISFPTFKNYTMITTHKAHATERLVLWWESTPLVIIMLVLMCVMHQIWINCFLTPFPQIQHFGSFFPLEQKHILKFWHFPQDRNLVFHKL